MVMVLVSVSVSIRVNTGFGLNSVVLTGWYDSTYDEELGYQPCIFTSVTPVSLYLIVSAYLLNAHLRRHGIM